jgi:hypothetical protein
VNQLFIHLYLDEDVSTLVAKLLRSRGFAVTTTLEASNTGRSDAEQLAHAAQAQMAIVTHNRADFEALAADYFKNGRSHGGIIIAVRRTAQEIARRLLVILNAVTSDEMRDQVRYV